MTAAREIRDGLRDIAPAAVAAIPIGLLFGALMASKGMSPLEVGLMSGFVCAGGAQLAAVGLWVNPAPILALAVSTALIDARHVLMSTSLARRTGGFAWWQKMLGFYVMSDENWALAERRAAERTLAPGYFMVMGATLWINWVTTTTLGAIGGAMLGDPTTYGADFAFTALFIGLAAAFVRGPSGFAVVAASGLAAAAAYLTVGAPWHVAAGAAAGVAAAWALAGERRALA